MASVSGRVNTVKEIYSPLNTFQNILRSSYPHQVYRFFFRQIRNCLLQNMVHFFMALAYCQASQSVSIQIQFPDLFGMLNTDILKGTSLIDTKQHLLWVDGIRQSVEPVHLRLTPFQPSGSTVYRILHIFSGSRMRRTFIKCHGNGRCQIGLDLHALFRSHEDLASIDVRVKVHTLFFDLSHFGQGKYLETAGIG